MTLIILAQFDATLVLQVIERWQQKIRTFYITVFDLNRQNVVVWCYENARNTFTQKIVFKLFVRL